MVSLIEEETSAFPHRSMGAGKSEYPISNKEPQNVEVWNRFALTFSGLSGSVEYLPSTFDIPCSILDIRFS